MKPKVQKRSQAAAEGQAAGARLVDSVPRLLLLEYGERPVDKDSAATQRLSAVMSELRSSLGHVSTDPAVADALHRLNGVIWDLVVEYEDRAWHAAWAVAIGLCGGSPLVGASDNRGTKKVTGYHKREVPRGVDDSD